MPDEPEHLLRAEAQRRLERLDPETPVPSPATLEHAQHELQVHRIELELQNDQLRLANEELELARREYEDLFDFAPVGYLTLDEHALVGRANQAASRQLGVPVQNLRRKRFTAYLSRSDATTFALFLRRVFEGTERRTVEVSLERPDGSSFVAQLEAQAVQAQGPARLCRMAVTDISAQRRAQDEVLRQNAALEERAAQRARHIRELGEELEGFADGVRHDLITPLQRLRQAAQDLQDAQPGQRPALADLQASAGRLDTLLSALLDLIRVGQQRLRLAPLDLNRVVTQAYREASEGQPPDAARFTLEPLPTVSGDETALRTLFRALLDNALKFSRNQTPSRVQVTTQHTPSEFVVCVRDNGVGFNMRRKGRLFGLFQRLHGEGEFPGVGLGLALVRRIALRHGGRVWAESRPEQGASFCVSFPRQPRDVV